MKIVIVAGSNRKEASSTRLAEYIKLIMESKGIQVSFIDLYKTALPFYSPDEINGEHEGLSVMKKAMQQADGIVLSSPEYHGSMTGVLKNALDHVGQDQIGGKAVLSVSSAGGAVGVSTLQHMQATVRNLHGINCPEWISIGGEQRISFMGPLDEGAMNPNLKLRIHKAIDTFLQLATVLGKRE
ncbi:NADPH-dependent FMN reductase [Paenibacillus hexagrammi]|uniref:NAD(P)H-dependent oxidoreductase n=1 Tax=Paenibacillus hexagrammi TaxID=2908839 RepID=A0ABY3SN59_9BACL|nr:NADPH-dependent FMN reductase [Paenibacillus sp. YPD9-1]UJF34555.1 NAD(P)H-dependent oxidoreductase [Paenibacillus sp. YPD9-1]